MATEIVCASRAEWMARRREGITASEIPIILGLSPWQSPFTLYWHKVAGYEEPDTPRMARGRRLERLIREDFQEAHPDLLTAMPIDGAPSAYAIMYASGDRPWQLATPDCVAWDSTARLRAGSFAYTQVMFMPVELKTAAGKPGWGPSGGDQIPLAYRAQLMWQIDVLDADRGYLAVWLGFDDYREYVINRDDDDIATMREAGETFLKQIRNGEEPAIDGARSTTQTLRQLHPHTTDWDAIVDDSLADSWQRARALVTRAKAHRTLIENKIRKQMGGAYKAADSNGRTVATRVIYTRKEHVVHESTVDRLFPGGHRD